MHNVPFVSNFLFVSELQTCTAPFLHSVVDSAVAGSCCSLKDGSAGIKGEEAFCQGIQQLSEVDRQTVRADRRGFLYSLPLLGRCLLAPPAKEGKRSWNTCPSEHFQTLMCPELLKKELSQGFKREELNLNAEGCQELAKDSFPSGVADSSTSAVSAISWCLVCELLLPMSRSIGVCFKHILVHSV